MLNEIVVVSGKGGTGKTSVTAAFAALAGRAVLADCDVDAADLHLVVPPEICQTHEFRAGKTAHIDTSKCSGCGICFSVCRFGAVRPVVHEDRPVSFPRYQVDDVSCDGCAVCARFCPKEAITMEQPVHGHWYVSETRWGPMVHARLAAARENSGKLVTLVRKAARRIAEEEGLELILMDGPPGIGCPVSASLTGASKAVVVCEPTVSGLHDLQRVAALIRHFEIPIGVVINKEDVNPQQASAVRDYAASAGVELLGSIPYDSTVTHAQVAGHSVIEEDMQAPVSKALRGIWERLMAGRSQTTQRQNNERTA